MNHHPRSDTTTLSLVHVTIIGQLFVSNMPVHRRFVAIVSGAIPNEFQGGIYRNAGGLAAEGGAVNRMDVV